MSTQPHRCRHLHTDGRQCGSPALRHEKLCYQHHAARQRPAHTPTLPVPEDLHAVQQGLAELLHLVSRELLDDRQAKRLFAILTAAGTNLARIDRQQARAADLNLRSRALALAEARLAAQHSDAGLSGCHSPRESASTTDTDPTRPAQNPGCPTFAAALSPVRWDRGATEISVTDPVHDPELGLIAPGPNPEPAPGPAPGEPGSPAFATASPALGWAGGHRESQSEQPTRARRRELEAKLEAEAAEQAAFQQRERAQEEERRQLRDIARQLHYGRLSPEDRRLDDARRAREQADYDACTRTPLVPHPTSTPNREINP